jgi:hypothetical protein
LERQEDYILDATNAIDTKAGLVLAAAAFLALQPSIMLIVPHIALCALVIQLISFVFVCVAVWFAHNVLGIEGYPNPVISEQWRDQQVVLGEQHNLSEDDTRKVILHGLINGAKERVALARSLNRKGFRYSHGRDGLPRSRLP